MGGAGMADFITIRSNRLKPAVVKKPITNVVLTSQNAVNALLENFLITDLNFENIYCVGKRTKRLIERKFGKVTKAENSALKLAMYLAENLEKKEITFFCGNKRRDELPDILNNHNIKVNEIACYQTQLTP